METKHSPAPWALKDWASHDKDGALETCGSQVVDANGHMISACTIEGATKAEEANARLIAAAPDLLFELEGIVAFADGFGIYGTGPAAQELRRWIEGARQAIAKATGRAA